MGFKVELRVWALRGLGLRCIWAVDLLPFVVPSPPYISLQNPFHSSVHFPNEEDLQRGPTDLEYRVERERL